MAVAVIWVLKGHRLENRETWILLSIPQLRKPSMKHLLCISHCTWHFSRPTEYIYIYIIKYHRCGNWSLAGIVWQGCSMLYLKEVVRNETAKCLTVAVYVWKAMGLWPWSLWPGRFIPPRGLQTPKLWSRVCEELGRHKEAALVHFYPYLVCELHPSCWRQSVLILINFLTQIRPLRSALTQWVK